MARRAVHPESRDVVIAARIKVGATLPRQRRPRQRRGRQARCEVGQPLGIAADRADLDLHEIVRHRDVGVGSRRRECEVSAEIPLKPRTRGTRRRPRDQQVGTVAGDRGAGDRGL